MKSFLGYFVVLFSFYLIEGGRFRCDYSYFSDGGGWFKIHVSPKTLNEAKAICNLEGTVLASPKDKGMEDTMLYLLSNSDAKAIHIENSYQDDNSVTLDEYRVMLDDGSYQRVVKDIKFPYICYKNAGASIPLNECGTLDNAYTLDNRTGSCYKYHRIFSTWDKALFTCSMEEGSLAIINSAVEAQVIRDIFSRNPRSTIPEESWKDGAFIGFYSTLDRNWYTIEGQSIAEAGYDLFSSGEPNNARGDEFCGSVARNGELVDDPCDRTLPFICEKRPDSGCNIQEEDVKTYFDVYTQSTDGTRTNNKYEKDDSEKRDNQQQDLVLPYYYIYLLSDKK